MSIGVLLLVLLGLATWVFDAGRQIASFDQNEFIHLKSTKITLEDEVAKLRNLLAASENSLQIEQAAQKLLAEKNSALVEENARLKEELAVIERLSKSRGKGDNSNKSN